MQRPRPVIVLVISSICISLRPLRLRGSNFQDVFPLIPNSWVKRYTMENAYSELWFSMGDRGNQRKDWTVNILNPSVANTSNLD